MSRLALIAGAGALPAELVAALDAPVLVCAPVGLAIERLAIDIPFHFERLAPFLRDLETRGITDVALAGAVHRPRLDPALFDRETAGLVPGLVGAMRGGDDAALRWVIALIEEFGFRVTGVADLAPGLLAPPGVLSHRAPNTCERADAARGVEILAALAPVDVGQGCVVAAGLCLGIEALFGTDALLADVARHRPRREPTRGGTFVKRAKAGQDLRADLPTIGPDTIAAAQAAGLSALCLQAGRVVLLDRARLVRAADAAGLALWAEG